VRISLAGGIAVRERAAFRAISFRSLLAITFNGV